MKRKPLSCTALCGYSAEKSNMENYNGDDIAVVKVNHSGSSHHQIKEMHRVSGMLNPPVMIPVTANFERGLLLTLPLPGHRREGRLQLPQKPLSTKNSWCGCTTPPTPSHRNCAPPSPFVDISIAGDRWKSVVYIHCDNLGKGAAVTAIQNMNLMLELDEYAGIL